MRDSAWIEKAQDSCAGITRYLFSAPKPHISLLLAIIIYSLIYFLTLPTEKNNILGLIIFLAAALLSPLIIHALLRAMESPTYLRRWSLLALLNAIVIFLMTLFYIATARFLPIAMMHILAFAMAGCVFYGIIVFRSVAAPSTAASIACALVMPAALVIALTISFGTALVVPFTMYTIAAIISAVTFLIIASRPCKRLLNTSPFVLLQPNLAQFTTRGKQGVREIESFFESIATKAKVWARVIRLRSDGSECFIVVPSVHPGPYGGLGGANIVEHIIEAIRERIDPNAIVAVMHGASTHDNDLVNSEEAMSMAESLAHGCADIKVESQRVSSTSTMVVGECTITTQRFDDMLLCSYTTAPEPTDDVDASVGEAFEQRILARSRGKGIREVVFVDCHNSLKPKVGNVFHGTPKADELVSMANRCPLPPEEEGFKYAAVQLFRCSGFKDDIGPGGMVVIVFSSGDRTDACILFDGNNMALDLRDRLIRTARKYVDKAEVYTTDTHLVNLSIGGYRPVGTETGLEILEAAVVKSVRSCIKKLKPGIVGAKRINLGEIDVLGSGNAALITMAINTTLSLLMPAFIVSSALYVLISIISSFISSLM